MEIELYSKSEKVNAELIHNTTRRERSPVSRTSDANFSMRAADCGCQLVMDYHCLSIMKLDHTKFTFDEALKHISYRTYYGLEITTALYLVLEQESASSNEGSVTTDNSQMIIEFFNDLHIPFALQYILPYLYSYDDKSYDVYKLFIDSLDSLDLTTIDPNTYFYYQIIPISGLTEITYDCSPKKYIEKVKSKIIFSHTDQIIAPLVIKKRVTSQISIIEKLRKV